MRKKKRERTRRDHANEWLRMTPHQHLHQAAAVIGAVPGDGDDAASGQLAIAQTHLMAGLLKAQLAGEGVSIPIDA